MDARLSPLASTPDSQWVQEVSEVFEAELRSLFKYVTDLGTLYSSVAQKHTVWQTLQMDLNERLIADAVQAKRIKQSADSVAEKIRRLEELALSYEEFLNVGKLTPYLYPFSEVAMLFTNVYDSMNGGGDNEQRKSKLFVSTAVLEAVDCLFTGFHTSVSYGYEA